MIDITDYDLYQPFAYGMDWDGTKYTMTSLWGPYSFIFRMKQQLAPGVYNIGVEFKVLEVNDPDDMYQWIIGQDDTGYVTALPMLDIPQQLFFEYRSYAEMETIFTVNRNYPRLEITKIFIQEDDPRFWRNFKGQTERV